jgi:hypothetical protein
MDFRERIVASISSGVFKRDYGELILTLAQDWDVRVLWYDWRKDLRVGASLAIRVAWVTPSEK